MEQYQLNQLLQEFKNVRNDITDLKEDINRVETSIHISPLKEEMMKSSFLIDNVKEVIGTMSQNISQQSNITTSVSHSIERIIWYLSSIDKSQQNLEVEIRTNIDKIKSKFNKMIVYVLVTLLTIMVEIILALAF